MKTLFLSDDIMRGEISVSVKGTKSPRKSTEHNTFDILYSRLIYALRCALSFPPISHLINFSLLFVHCSFRYLLHWNPPNSRRLESLRLFSSRVSIYDGFQSPFFGRFETLYSASYKLRQSPPKNQTPSDIRSSQSGKTLKMERITGNE